MDIPFLISWFFMGRFMLRFPRCFLYAMESLLVLRKWGGDRAITSPFFSAPPLRCRDLSLPVVPFYFALRGISLWCTSSL